MYNMQSGILRRTFNVGPCPANVASRFRPTGTKRKDERCITGLASDALDRIVVASTLDGTVNVCLFPSSAILGSNEKSCDQFFDFHTAELEHTLVLPSAAVSITLHRDSGLLAVICDDLIVRIVDIETRRVVRELGGFRGRVLDVVSLSSHFYSAWHITLTCYASARPSLPIPDGLSRHHSTPLSVRLTCRLAG